MTLEERVATLEDAVGEILQLLNAKQPQPGGELEQKHRDLVKRVRDLRAQRGEA